MKTQAPQYFAALKREQELNTKLGCGTDEIQWNEKQYQEALREQKKELRLQRAQQKTP